MDVNGSAQNADNLKCEKILKKARLVLKSKSGVSLIFVLAVMFFLFWTGGSILTAAETGRGTVRRQVIHNQMLVLDDSIHNNIRHSLQNGNGKKDSLWFQIVNALYEMEKDGDVEETLYLRLTDDILDISDGNVEVESVVLSFPKYDDEDEEPKQVRFVDITPAQPADFIVSTGYLTGDTPGNKWILNHSRIPRSATINARMIVTVVIKSKITDDASMTTVAEYVYTGVENGFSDAEAAKALPIHQTPIDPDDPPCSLGCQAAPALCRGLLNDMSFTPGGEGRWHLIKRGEQISEAPDDNET